MRNLRTIQIDLAIHKAIEKERKTLDEPEMACLHRLLKISPIEESKNEGFSAAASKKGISLGYGVFLPNGAQLRMRFHGKIHDAEIRDGKFQVNGKAFSAPSPAAMAITVYRVNGWIKWEVKFPGSVQWRLLDLLRERSGKSLFDLEIP